jgi:hypothetical protein
MVLLRPLTMALAGVLAVATVPVRTAATIHQATFRTRTDVVSVNVSVKQGRQPVGNLTSGDFALTDNGVEQTVDALALARMPIDLTLVIAGYETLNRDDRDAYFRALTSASDVRRSLLAKDRLRLVSVHNDILGRLVSLEESLLPREMEIDRLLGVSLVDGLFYAMAWPVEPDRRHLVVAFTDGFDRFSVLDREMLPRLVAHSDAVLHVVLRANAAYAQGPLRSEWEIGQAIVSEAARRTGGTVRTATDTTQDLTAIIEDYRTSYVLQYTPRATPAPGWHELRVRVTRAGRFDVRAKHGYEVGRE